MTSDRADRRGVPSTLWIGLAIIGVTELMLVLDVVWRGGVVLGPGSPLPPPEGMLEQVARRFAVWVTPLCWAGYLFAFEGLLTWLARRRGEGTGCVRRRPWLFVACFLTSVPVWCYWDWVNFYFMDAWRYYGMSPWWQERYVGYFIAFGAISPGMFLAAQLYQRLGLRRLRSATTARTAKLVLLVCGIIGLSLTLGLMHLWRDRLTFGVDVVTSAGLLLFSGGAALALGLLFRGTKGLYLSALILGVSWVAFSLIVANPIGNFVLWISVLFLLDPINASLGAPSLLRDWQAGRWGRTIALMAGGATCGLCWEFWNYWAASKWVYDLPFLGATEQYRYFEMPLVGFVGFLPFGATCWVMLQTLLLMMPRFAEPLPGADDVL